ncbi:hypothetical protein TRVL_06969 [Trypanosoma vivax]|nr:hypothetical protein TRVL_06969 [Trypanosoma vivax]
MTATLLSHRARCAAINRLHKKRGSHPRETNNSSLEIQPAPADVKPQCDARVRSQPHRQHQEKLGHHDSRRVYIRRQKERNTHGSTDTCPPYTLNTLRTWVVAVPFVIAAS